MGRQPSQLDFFQIWLEVITHGPDGKLTGHTVQETHSWLSQAPRLFRALMTVTDETSITDTAGVNRTAEGDAAEKKMQADSAVAVTTHGILAGTGTTAADRDDFAMGTLVAEGSGAGQLNYQATLTTFALVTGGSRVTISRQLINNSSGAITINEAGLAVRGDDASAVERFWLILRDLISPGKEILGSGGTQTVRYLLDALV